MRWLAAVIAMTRAAAADSEPTKPADRAVQAAGEANLESESKRQGITLQVAVGGGLILGFGVEDVAGNGPSASFRLGRVATKNSLVTLEASFVTPRHAVKATMSSDQYLDQAASLLLGGQYYLNGALWVRGAAGIGGYHGEHKQDGATAGDIDLAGPAVAVGAGVEVVRFARWAIGLEMFGVSMVNRDGVMSSSGFLIDAMIY